MSGTHRPFPQPRWLFTVDNDSCWLAGTPTITSAGQVAFEAEIDFLLTFHSWLVASVAGKKLALDGVISGFDYELNEQQRYEFKAASVTSLGFPMLDGLAKAPGRVTLTLNARSLTTTPASRGVPAGLPTQLPWRCSDFRLLIDNVNTTKVNHIDPIHMTIPGPLPEVNVLVPAIDIKQFVDWQKSGAPAASRIDFLGPDRVRALFTLSFTSKVRSIAQSANGTKPHSRKPANRITSVPVALNVMALAFTKG
jgi:hypothetical protein